mgnify:FL=1
MNFELVLNSFIRAVVNLSAPSGIFSDNASNAVFNAVICDYVHPSSAPLEAPTFSSVSEIVLFKLSINSYAFCSAYYLSSSLSIEAIRMFFSDSNCAAVELLSFE